jgi:hypothetical protein
MREKRKFSVCLIIALAAFVPAANASQQAHDPYPADGAEDVPHNVCLSWSPGEEPCPPPLEFFVFFSTDYDQVADGNLAAMVGHDLEVNECCVEDLCLSATYYWRVIAVCDCYTAEGDVWSFTVASCVIFDDMESYTNSCSNSIWKTWIDGAGDCLGMGGNGTGSTVYSATDPDPEQSDKVMEYWYNNTGWEHEYPYSEATRSLDPPVDFSGNCERVLVLWFYGDAESDAESMWVLLSDGTTDGQVTYGMLGPDSPDDIKNAEWKDFVIDLNDFIDAGVDVSAVTEISIGFGDRGRTGEFPGDPVGVVYFDDISLCTNICVSRYMLADFNGDCFVSLEDYTILASRWFKTPGSLSVDIAPEPPDGFVDWRDLGVLTDSWLQEQLWPLP